MNNNIHQSTVTTILPVSSHQQNIPTGTPTESIPEGVGVQYYDPERVDHQMAQRQYMPPYFAPHHKMDGSLPSGMPMLPFPNQYTANLLPLKQAHPYGLQIPYPMIYPNIVIPTPAQQPIVQPTTNTQPNPHITTMAITTPQIIFRNLFHTVNCKFSAEVSEWEGCRVYVSDNVGYSGNAKRFKKKPEPAEKALHLDCAVVTSSNQHPTQCLSCKDYFETQKYYKANPECIGRIVLVKNNAPIRIENAQFKLLIKMMCCCPHHSVDFFTFQLHLYDAQSTDQRLVYASKIPLNVKQWRKSNQKKDDCHIVLDSMGLNSNATT